MQKMTISICGEHVRIAVPTDSRCVSEVPALYAAQRLLGPRKALQPFERSTPTHHEKLVESLVLTGKVVAAWGTPRTAKFRRYGP